MADLEIQSGDLALIHNVGLEPENRNGREDSDSHLRITIAEEEVQAAQLQSLFEAKDESSR